MKGSIRSELLRERVEAVDAERAIVKRAKKQGTCVEPAQETLEEYGKAWIKRKEARLARSTIAGYRSFFNREVLPRLGEKRLVALRPSDFDNLAAVADACQPRTRQWPLRAERARALDRPRHTLHPSNWNRRIWQPAITKAELDGLGYTWHDLRHSCVSRLIAQGADIAIVQAVAGHASASTTLKVYAQVTAKRLESAALEFDPGRAPLAER